MNKFIFILLAVLCLLPISSANAAINIDNSDLPSIKSGDLIILINKSTSNVPNDKYRYLGPTTVKDRSGMVLGYLPLFERNIATLDGYNLIPKNQEAAWATALNGNPDFVLAHINNYYVIVNWQSYNPSRSWIREFAELCGTNDVDWNRKNNIVTIGITKKPEAFLSAPTQARKGDTITINATGWSKVTGRYSNKVSYNLYADGQWLAGESLTSPSFKNKLVNYTITKNPGQAVTLELRVTDGVSRTTTITQNIDIVENPASGPPVSSGPPEPPEPPAPPTPPNYKPIADFNASSYTPMEGEEVTLTDASTIGGGEKIATWEWQIDGIGLVYRQGPHDVTWPAAGKYTVRLKVTDEDGDYDVAMKDITVAPVDPVAVINQSARQIIAGRAVSIDGDKSKSGPTRTIDWPNNHWVIKDPGGAVKLDKTQRYPWSTTVSGYPSMFTTTGTWDIALQVKDLPAPQRISEWTHSELKVVKDKPPIADFWVPSTAVRYSVDNYQVTVQDRSLVQAPDGMLGDEIGKRTWTLYYDKNNNGSYTDPEDEVIHADDTGKSARIVQANDNDPAPKLQFSLTGRYKLELTVQEKFTDAAGTHYGLTADTSGKPLAEKVIMVGNVAPRVGFDVLPHAAVDVTFVVDDVDDAKAQSLESNLGLFTQKLREQGLQPNIEIEKRDIIKGAPMNDNKNWLNNDQSAHPYITNGTTVQLDLGNMDHRGGNVVIASDGSVYVKVGEKVFKVEKDGSKILWSSSAPWDNDANYEGFAVNPVTGYPTVVYSGEDDNEHEAYVKAYNPRYGFNNWENTTEWNGDWDVGYPMVGPKGKLYSPAYVLNHNGTKISDGLGNYNTVVTPDDNIAFRVGYVWPRWDPDYQFVEGNGWRKYGYSTNLDKRTDFSHRWYRLGDMLYANDKLFILGMDHNYEDGYLFALNPDNGDEYWNLYVGNYQDLIFSIDGYLHVVGDNSTLVVDPDAGIRIKTLSEGSTARGTTRMAGNGVKYNGNEWTIGPGGYRYKLVTDKNWDTDTYKTTLEAFIPNSLDYRLSSVSFLGSKAQPETVNSHGSFLVDVTDTGWLDYNLYGNEAVSKMQAAGVNLVAITPTSNNAQFNNAISKVGGTCINTSSNMAGPLTNLANYIAGVISYQPKPDYVLLVDQEFSVKTYFDDAENDKKIDEQWYISHDSKHLMNYTLSNQGTQIPAKYYSTPPVSFGTAGTYTVKYRAKDEPPNVPYQNDSQAGRKWSDWSEASIYVHRLPIASFTVSTTEPGVGQTVSYTDKSYDPDLQNTDPQGKKGIRNREWQYRLNGGEWISSNEPPTTFDKANATVEVRLRVQDFLGAWSDWAYQTIRVKNRAPEAYFITDPNYVTKDTPTKLIDASTDPDGDRIVAWNWSWKWPMGDGIITQIRFRGNSEYKYDYGYLYGWDGSQWDYIYGMSGNYDKTLNFNVSKNYSKLKVRLKTDSGYLTDPTYIQVYEVTVNGRKFNPNLYLSTTENNQDIESGEWVVPQKLFSSQQNPTFTWNVIGSYDVTLKVMDEHGLWSAPYTRTIQVNEINNPPIARLSGPSTAYTDEQLIMNGTSSYDPDPGDYVKYAYWRYKKPGQDWAGPWTQTKGQSGFLTCTVTPDVEGDWQFELIVEDSHGALSAPAYRTVHVEEGFEVRGSIIPNPAERGRKIRVTAEAYRPGDDELMQIDRMEVVIPYVTRPDGTQAMAVGQSAHRADMTYVPATKQYTYDYLLPDRSKHGYFPDDGLYYVQIIGHKGSSTKSDLLELEIKGHIMRRIIIRTIN